MDYPPKINEQLLAWFNVHGRKNLPWQQQINPYRVWVSEIMLQQTQVNTVIPYYQRFMQRFPTIEALATAPLDDVLHHWTGLGYYARARNLHKAAYYLFTECDSQFPTSLEEVMALSGIGRSTAGAILSLACGQHQVILDGNVKRVLTRYHALSGWTGQRKIEQQLWDYAGYHTPDKNTAAYTQAIMDLGATVCTRSRPNCEQCPLNAHCRAYQHDTVSDYPTPKPRKKIPTKKRFFIMLEHPQGILLEKRPDTGIWGGLWSFPECDNLTEVKHWYQQQTQHKLVEYEKWETVRHTFTHFHLDITPIHIKTNDHNIAAEAHRVWYTDTDNTGYGLAAPVKKLLTQLNPLTSY